MRSGSEYPFGAMGKLLLLTAQRRDEVAGMRWAELDLPNRVWVIPRERAKNDRAHTVHLNDLAMEVLQAVPRIGAEPEYVLTTTGDSPISGYSKAKAAIDRRMGDGHRAMGFSRSAPHRGNRYGEAEHPAACS